MCLVDDERVIRLQERVALRFGQQNAIGHQLDRGAFLQPVGKAHLVAHHLAQWRVQFLRDALGDAAGGNAPGLGVPDELGLFSRSGVTGATAHGQCDLGQLGRFA